MCFSPSPPPPAPKAIFSSNLTFGYKCRSNNFSFHNTSYHCEDYNRNRTVGTKGLGNMQRPEAITNVKVSKTEEESTSDYKQWLHAMKLVARLPGGIPPEFRRKLWRSLADKYLKSKNVDWDKEEEKCFREKWREDDEELGIQIVKDLHRTGSTFCTGPAGDLNQAKLKRILLGYARYNPEVGYCQGFNMLGALILQVMDKHESESIKVMIYLVEGILPTGYFCGSMGGLQTDMAVFRELMQTKLPRLAKHLQKLQGPIENAYEPPLTNVFTMQWFLTMFCTCLPMSCVLRVWDLVLIEGSDVLLRTALALWSLLEERVLSARTADDFYGKMGSFSSELLNGHLIDSNGLIEKVVQLGPISDIQRLRDKHLYTIAPIGRQQGLQLYFDDDEPDIDEDSRLAVATVWGIPWGRRGSQGQTNNNVVKPASENKDRIALDISLLKKQYDRLRERQKQAQIILTTACTTASRQSTTATPLPVNQLLSGRPAIITNKGRRSGPPTGAIPPARKPSLPAVLHDKPLEKQLRRGNTLYWRDTKDTGVRRDSLSWKEIKSERAAMITSGSIDGLKSQKIRSGRLGKSDSSSYSEESDENEEEFPEDASSTDTSLCDEDIQPIANDKKQKLYIENNHSSSSKTLYKLKKQRSQMIKSKDTQKKTRPKSWAPSNTEIPFILMTTDYPNHSADENIDPVVPKTPDCNELEDETQTNLNHQMENLKGNDHNNVSHISEETTTPFDKFGSISATKEDVTILDATISLGGSNLKDDNIKTFDISNEGVTNEYFERVQNSSERPTKLDLFYSLNEDENVRELFKIQDEDFDKPNEEARQYANDETLNKSNSIRCMDLLVDYSEKSSAACIEEAKTEISTSFQPAATSVAISLKKDYSAFQNDSLLKKTKSSSEKRRDPRRLTLTRSSTMDIEKRYEAFEKRFSMEICSNYTKFSDESEFNMDCNIPPHQIFIHNNMNSDLMSHTTNHIKVTTTATATSEKCISVEKIIPSTADLEQRFDNIQQQLVRDRNRMIKSPCDSENTEKQPNFNTSADNNVVKRDSQNDKTTTKQLTKHDDNQEDNGKIEGEQISNAHSDIEDKPSSSNQSKNFNKVNTSTDTKIKTVKGSPQSTESEINPSLQSKKEPPDGNKNQNVVEKDDLKENYVSETERNKNKKAEERKENVKESDIGKSFSEMSEETSEENHESFKKAQERLHPPSTEELEKRFCALEEQMNSEKKGTNATQRSAHNESEGIFEKTDVLTMVSESVDKSSNKHEIDSRRTGGNISNKSTSPDDKTSLTKFDTSENNSKRRLSEPPSTEDLERRYEVLKRRMSSRNFETRANELQQANKKYMHKSTVNSLGKPTPPSIENLEARFEKLQHKSESKGAIITDSPPSMENLEERFVKLQNTNKTKHSPDDREKYTDEDAKSAVTEPTTSENKSGNENNTKHPDKDSSANTAKHSSDNVEVSEKIHIAPENSGGTKTLINPLSKNANKIKIKLIEELQAKIREHSINTDVESSIENKMKIIEELKTKIDPWQDKPLKPTQISSRRKAPTQSVTSLLQSLSFNDETLESHAASAYRRSGKHEPSSATDQKMVRRFSDLPSRADLENRLKFLEEQLSKTVCMQRRSSDSEVASKARLKQKTTLANIPRTDSIEYRVQELEKRLKDNKTFSMDVDCSNASDQHDTNIDISQVELASNSAAVTGNEIVRYSSHGEVGDIEHQNPINISINIQMTLNKEDIGTKKNSDVTKTDDIDRRLQFLEQQLKTSLLHETSGAVAENASESIRETEMKRNIKLTDNADENEKENAPNDKHDEDNEDINTLNTGQSNQIFTKTSEDVQSKITKDEGLSTIDQPSHATKISENIEIQNIKQTESYLQKDERSYNVGNLSQDIKTNRQMKNTESVDVKQANKVHDDDTTFQNQPAGESKEIENKQIRNENEAFDKLKSEDKSKNSSSDLKTPNESKQISSNNDENLGNPTQQDAQSNEITDAQELAPSIDYSKSPSKKITEPDISEVNETANVQKDNSSETENTSKVEKLVGLNNCSQFVPVEVNKKTLVLLLNNEPKAVKVRRLTRANTQELEDLFQALEKQLSDRGQQKPCEKILKTALDETTNQAEIQAAAEVSNLAKEIEAFSKGDSKQTEQKDKLTREKQKKQDEIFDWGSDPIKYHLKKRTVYLPSTKELEARFRSLERQIKLMEDVEKIDVEQRLIEIERKIKLQYSLSHEKDLNKFLELCEGKDPDEISTLENHQDRRECCTVDVVSDHNHNRNIRQTSPTQLRDTDQSRHLEYSYRCRDLKRSKSKQNLKKQPIHRLEMLLDPSPDDSDIPTTGELEHRIRVMEENRCTPPSPSSRKSRSQSPPIKQKNTHMVEKMTASPTERELPTAEELEARLEALERDQCFNFKMQKNFQQFNQKLKDVVSPSLSFDEFKSPTKTCDSGQNKIQPCTPSKQPKSINTTSPKSLRFYDDDQPFSQKEIEYKKKFSQKTDSQQTSTVREGLGVMGIRLMRETSPLRRKGTHTGVPLRTGENINDRLTSIQNTIKSIDSLCEEKPYRKERCQQYIDSLFSDSTYFAHKKTSLEDLILHNRSRSTSREIGPSIRISDHSPAISRSMGSADSIQLSTPLRSSSPLQYRSNRDLRREPSPRRRREEDREEHESRVRRDNLLPNNINNSHSILSHISHNSLTKFHKVDSQLIPTDVENEHELAYEESLRHRTTFGTTIDNTIYHDNTNTSTDINITSQRTSQNSDRYNILPIYPANASHTPVYSPAKLEIRHTTVTSTFYDRVLTEKQLEKQHHLSFPTNNKYSLISPQFENHVEPKYKQEPVKSPTMLLHNDTINTLTLTNASTGNYHRSYQSHMQTNNHN